MCVYYGVSCLKETRHGVLIFSWLKYKSSYREKMRKIHIGVCIVMKILKKMMSVIAVLAIAIALSVVVGFDTRHDLSGFSL